VGSGAAPFYVDLEAAHRDDGAVDLLHYLEVGSDRFQGTSYCGRPVVLADSVEVETTEEVCPACEAALRAAHPRAFVPPGSA